MLMCYGIRYLFCIWLWWITIVWSGSIVFECGRYSIGIDIHVADIQLALIFIIIIVVTENFWWYIIIVGSIKYESGRIYIDTYVFWSKIPILHMVVVDHYCLNWQHYIWMWMIFDWYWYSCGRYSIDIEIHDNDRGNRIFFMIYHYIRQYRIWKW